MRGRWKFGSQHIIEFVRSVIVLYAHQPLKRRQNVCLLNVSSMSVGFGRWVALCKVLGRRANLSHGREMSIFLPIQGLL